MAVISQELSEYTGDIPEKNFMPPEEFDLAAESWADHQLDLGGGINTWAQEVNAVAASANDLYDTAADVNFKGKWANLTGAIYRPAVVWHGHRYWMLIPAFLADITLYEPAQGSGVWYPIGLHSNIFYADGSTVVPAIPSDEIYFHKPLIYTDQQTAGNISVILPSPQEGMKARFYCGSDYLLRCFVYKSRIRWGARIVSDALYYSYVYTQTRGTVFDLTAHLYDRDSYEWIITHIFGGILYANTAPAVSQT